MAKLPISPEDLLSDSLVRDRRRILRVARQGEGGQRMTHTHLLSPGLSPFLLDIPRLKVVVCFPHCDCSALPYLCDSAAQVLVPPAWATPRPPPGDRTVLMEMFSFPQTSARAHTERTQAHTNQASNAGGPLIHVPAPLSFLYPDLPGCVKMTSGDLQAAWASGISCSTPRTSLCSCGHEAQCPSAFTVTQYFHLLLCHLTTNKHTRV